MTSVDPAKAESLMVERRVSIVNWSVVSNPVLGFWSPGSIVFPVMSYSNMRAYKKSGSGVTLSSVIAVLIAVFVSSSCACASASEPRRRIASNVTSFSCVSPDCCAWM